MEFSPAKNSVSYVRESLDHLDDLERIKQLMLVIYSLEKDQIEIYDRICEQKGSKYLSHHGIYRFDGYAKPEWIDGDGNVCNRD